jgi:hypothetical protein
MSDQQPKRRISKFKTPEMRTIVGDVPGVLQDQDLAPSGPPTDSEAKAANDFMRRMAEGFALPEEADDDGTKEC